MERNPTRFELYEDTAGEWRRRLHHRNGTVIADASRGYSTKQRCQQGMNSVRHHAFGAGTYILDDTDEESNSGVESPTAAIPATDSDHSQGTFELYEDRRGEWRWRLRHDNGNTIPDSGEGYPSRSNLKQAVERVRVHIVSGVYLEIDPAAYEIIRDIDDEWRWRLLHRNGNIIADSGEGYSRRHDARRAVRSVSDAVKEAEVTET